MSTASSPQTSSFVLDTPTVLSLAFALGLGPIAQFLANNLLPRSVPRSTYYLFCWHCYDALTHFFIEGSYLYHCFFSYLALDVPVASSDFPHPASIRSEPVPYYLGRKDRKYGPFYGQGPSARLWQEYAKADRRWGGSDVNVISIELLTVGLAGPFAAYTCYLLYKIGDGTSDRNGKKISTTNVATWTARLHILMTILATGELYGGFMTFSPEWLSGSTALDTSNPVYLWFYLFFFNVLWVFIPIAILIWVWGEVARVYRDAAGVAAKAGKEETRGKKRE